MGWLQFLYSYYIYIYIIYALCSSVELGKCSCCSCVVLMSTCSEYYDQLDKILVRVLPTQLLSHATQQTRTMYAYVYQCTKLRRPNIWFTYVRSGIAASILVETRLRLDLGSSWSVCRYSNAQVRSLTARELPQQYKGYLVYCRSDV